MIYERTSGVPRFCLALGPGRWLGSVGCTDAGTLFDADVSSWLFLLFSVTFCCLATDYTEAMDRQ